MSSLLLRTPLLNLGGWSPKDLTTKEYWYKYTARGFGTPPDVNSWTNLSTDGLSGINALFTGTPATDVSSVANGKPGTKLPINATANLTSPLTAVVIDESLPWSFNYWHQGPTLVPNDFYRLLTFAGISPATSASLFYATLPGLPLFYLQLRNTTVDVIGVSGFDHTVPHHFLVNYNGGGYGSASSFEIFLNGVPQVVTHQTSGGGNNNTNNIGGAVGGATADYGTYLELFFAHQLITGDDFDGLQEYSLQEYALGYPLTFDPIAAVPNLRWYMDSQNVIGSPVTLATDLSGNGNDVVFPSGRQPTLGTGVNSIQKMILTDVMGGNWGTTPEITASAGFTAVCVFRGDSTALNPLLINAKTADGYELRIQVVPSVGGYSQLTCTIIGLNTVNIGIATYYSTHYQTLHSLFIEYNGLGADTAANWRFTLNGGKVATATDVNTLGSPFGVNSLGTPSPGSPGFDPAGDWYVAFLAQGPLSDNLRRNLYNFYRLKYSLPVG